IITVLIFFFQAEDGIRDFHVTGVQTCALPISANSSVFEGYKTRTSGIVSAMNSTASTSQSNAPSYSALAEENALQREQLDAQARSEERRVGKECRSGRWLADGSTRYHEGTKRA